MTAPRRSVIRPTPPNAVQALAESTDVRFADVAVAAPERLLSRLADAGITVDTDLGTRRDAGRDWWPLSIGWADAGAVPARPAAVVRPATTEQVAAVLAACSGAGVPVTAAGGRSGVCGASVPVYGGIALDMTAMAGVVRLDEESLLADVRAGTFGPDLEAALGAAGEGYTLGHWPQSMDLSTVGGWLACRGAGQYSTRYGKIEDLVIGLEVVLADGTVVRTEGWAPRAATGPSLTQLFVGSEGTLGVITEARLRVRPRPAASGRRAYGFSSFDAGLDACRRVLRRGATPAVLRLYDRVESERNLGVTGSCVLVVLDEADPGLLAATLEVVDQECGRGAGGVGTGAVAGAGAAAGTDTEAGAKIGGGAERLDDELVGRWLEHRNDVSALAPLWRGGIVVDTAEVAGAWSVLPALASAVVDALQAVPGTLMASTHQSHAYTDGACLYFTFAGQEPGGSGAAETIDARSWAETYYRQAWDALTEVVARHGAAISHHHGIGLNRARFLADALGPAHGVLVSIKQALDPAGVLNPGKLGLPVPAALGEVPWP